MKNSIEINGTELTINGKTVVISIKRMKLFKLLLAGNGKVVKEQYLMKALHIISRHTLNQHVSQLRKSLSVFDELRIVTMSKVGYCLKVKGEEVRTEKRWMYIDKADADDGVCTFDTSLYSTKPDDIDDAQIVGFEVLVK